MIFSHREHLLMRVFYQRKLNFTWNSNTLSVNLKINSSKYITKKQKISKHKQKNHFKTNVLNYINIVK